MHKDLTGQKFGKLLVISLAYIKNGRTYFDCICDCGNRKIVLGCSLRSGATKSCGCNSKKHSLWRHRLYAVWMSMKQRCYNPNRPEYKYYGGKGVYVCDEWRNDFQRFYDWSIENGYDEKSPRGTHTLDRINVNGSYEPDNCRWVDTRVQSNNRTTSHYITKGGITHTISEWANILNITPSTIVCRIKRGWSEVDALVPRKKRSEWK